MTNCWTSDLLPLGPRCHLFGWLSAHYPSFSLSLSTPLDPQLPTPRARPKFTVTLHDTTDGFSPLRSSSPIRLRSARANPLDPSADHRISLSPPSLSRFTPDGIEMPGVEVVGIDTVVSSGAGIRVRVTR